MSHEPPAKAISVIIPAWGEGEPLLDLIRRISDWPEICEIIVSMVDATATAQARVECASAIGGAPAVCIAASAPNRGRQMNCGARRAGGEWLLFHHADTALTHEHAKALAALGSQSEIVGGAFYRKFDERHPHCRWIEPLERWHNRTCGALYGDQSIFVRRLHFQETLHGFADVPLMEDIEFSKRLRRSGTIALLDPPLATSPRKHLSRGPWRTTFMHAWLILLYKLGASPKRLHGWYYPASGANLPPGTNAGEVFEAGKRSSRIETL